MLRWVVTTTSYSFHIRFAVSIPAGIDNGQSIRIREKGEPGDNGGPRGDLLVEVVVSRNPNFQRDGYDVFSTKAISFAEAALGADVRINTIDGEILYTIKPGTQSDTKVRFKSKGIPTLRNKQVRGDHYVTLVVQVPTKLTEEQKDLLRKYDEAVTGKTSTASTDDKSEKGKKGKKGRKLF